MFRLGHELEEFRHRSRRRLGKRRGRMKKPVMGRLVAWVSAEVVVVSWNVLLRLRLHRVDSKFVAVRDVMALNAFISSGDILSILCRHLLV